jgi:hypothetical protein
MMFFTRKLNRVGLAIKKILITRDEKVDVVLHEYNGGAMGYNYDLDFVIAGHRVCTISSAGILWLSWDKELTKLAKKEIKLYLLNMVTIKTFELEQYEAVKKKRIEKQREERSKKITKDIFEKLF